VAYDVAVKHTYSVMWCYKAQKKKTQTLVFTKWFSKGFRERQNKKGGEFEWSSNKSLNLMRQAL